MVQASADFPNRNYTVKERPTDEALTFRQVLTWVGQIACRYWKCDAYGRLTSGWYDTAVFGRHNGMDGGVFDDGTRLIRLVTVQMAAVSCLGQT